MRHLASLPDGGQAENFADYLTGLGIANSRDESGGKWAIWVEREEQLDQAKREWQQFQQSPGDEKYQKATRSARAFESAQEQLAHRLARNFVNARLQHAQSEAGDQRTFPATLILIGISVLVALLSQFGADTGRIDGFFFLPRTALVYLEPAPQLISYFGAHIWFHLLWHELAVIRHGQVWRLVTPIFIHFGFPHLLFDMWWLWDLGKMIERRKGTVFFAILVLVSAVISNLAQFAWSGPGFGGMSGVVYALFGYAWMKGIFQPTQRVGVSQSVIWIMLGWLLLCMTGMLSRWIGDVANTAHLVGMLVGMAFGIVPWLWLRARRQVRSAALQ